jgi:small-conductance mechanosensitive channel
VQDKKNVQDAITHIQNQKQHDLFVQREKEQKEQERNAIYQAEAEKELAANNKIKAEQEQVPINMCVKLTDQLGIKNISERCEYVVSHLDYLCVVLKTQFGAENMGVVCKNHLNNTQSG